MIANEFQITNCNFTYAPLAAAGNNYRYINIASTSGESIIANNTFVSDSGPTNCRFISITDISGAGGTLQGQLLIDNNTQVASPFTLRHLLVIEKFIGSDFQLYINNNTTINEGNAPVLLNSPNLSIFKFIQVEGNSVQNTDGKGLIGIDTSFTGTTYISSSGNTIANLSFAVAWASATSPVSFIVGYRTTIVPAPLLLLDSCWLDTGSSLIGPTGTTGATGSTASSPSLAFTNTTGPIAVFPPLNTEVIVTSVTQSVVINQNLKIDYSLAVLFTVTANWVMQFEVRLYRDGVLIQTRIDNRSGQPAGSQKFPIGDTYVDTAPATNASSTYQIRIIVTTATNIISASTGSSIDLNIITFTP